MDKIIDYTITEEGVKSLSDKDLARLFMYTDRDRKELDVAALIWYWCIEEINRRIDLDEEAEIYGAKS